MGISLIYRKEMMVVIFASHYIIFLLRLFTAWLKRQRMIANHLKIKICFGCL